MKPFNLERALAGDKVITRDGRNIIDLHFFKDAKYSSCPIHALDDAGCILTFTRNGFYIDEGKLSPNDLFMASKKVKGYIAIQAKRGDICPHHNTTNFYYSREHAQYAGRSSLGDFSIHEIEIEV